MSYEGWKNFETWNVNLWLANDQGLYQMALELVQDSGGDLHDLRVSLKDLFEQTFEDQIDIPSGPISDILNAGLREIDWREIAEHWIEDYEADDDDDDDD